MNVDYKAVKNGFIAKARTLDQFFIHDYQVTDNDADANRGGEYFMILKPGAVPITFVPNIPTKKIYNVDWNIIFDLQLRYKNYKESWNKFTVIRDAVLNLFVFTLDKTLPDVLGIWDIVMNAPEPPGQKPPEANPTWIGQRMIAVVTQRIDITR